MCSVDMRTSTILLCLCVFLIGSLFLFRALRSGLLYPRHPHTVTHGVPLPFRFASFYWRLLCTSFCWGPVMSLIVISRSPRLFFLCHIMILILTPPALRARASKMATSRGVITRVPKWPSVAKRYQCISTTNICSRMQYAATRQ